MRKFFLTMAAVIYAASMYGQSPAVDSVASQGYSDRYDRLVARMGAAGVGVETLLDNWEKIDPDNRKLLLAKYNYYFTKGRTTTLQAKAGKKYLGNAPMFSLKDSTGTDVNYFEEPFYDDSLFAISLKYIDRAIELYPKDMDLRFVKATSLISYEKDSPDMATVYLTDLVDHYYSSKGVEWTFRTETVDNEFFEGAMQEYCYAFFNIASPSSYLAFRTLSEKMSQYNPSGTMFISNLGSYYFVVEKDSKKAMKYYKKVLKINPTDYIASKNCVLICRRAKDTKKEAKYLPGMIASSPDENERMSAQARLEVLTKKK